MSAIEEPQMRKFVQDWRDSMEAMLELPDDYLAEKLSILFDAKRPVGERTMTALADYYRRTLEPASAETLIAHGEARGFAGAARILCRVAGYDEPAWVTRELDA